MRAFAAPKSSACLAASLLACLVVGIVPAAAAAPAALTAPPVATPAVLAAPSVDAALQAWYAQAPDWQEDFGAASPLWPAGAAGGSNRFVAQGAYHIEVGERRTLSLGVTPQRAGSFLFEAGVRQAAGPLDSEYGLLFGCRQAGDCYFFAASSDGYFLLDAWQDGERQTLIAPAPAAALHTGLGTANRLGVAVQDGVITLYANGAALASRYAPQWEPGYVGLGVATNRQGGAAVLFDDAALWRAPGQGEEAWQSGLGDLLAGLPAVPAAAPAPAPAPAADPLAAGLAALRALPPTWEETFAAEDEHWFAGEIGHGACAYADGALALAVDGAAFNWCAHFDGTLELPPSYLLEVTATQPAALAQPPLVCLWFGRHGLDGYEWCISDARYTFSYLAQDGHAEPLIETVSSAVKVVAGGQNRLGVLVEGTTVTLLVDSQPLQSYEDDEARWKNGGVALLAVTGDNDGVTILFDDLRLWAVTEPLAAGGAGIPATATPTPPALPELAGLPIAWDALLERFAVSNIAVTEVLEPGHKLPDYFVTFDFEVIADASPQYSVQFLNAADEVKRVTAVEFVPDPANPPSLYTWSGWRTGLRGQAQFALPRDFARYPAIVIASTY